VQLGEWGFVRWTGPLERIWNYLTETGCAWKGSPWTRFFSTKCFSTYLRERNRPVDPWSNPQLRGYWRSLRGYEPTPLATGTEVGTSFAFRDQGPRRPAGPLELEKRDFGLWTPFAFLSGLWRAQAHTPAVDIYTHHAGVVTEHRRGVQNASSGEAEHTPQVMYGWALWHAMAVPCAINPPHTPSSWSLSWSC
jgi:hypothetical protein